MNDLLGKNQLSPALLRETPYCQIAGREITSTNCLETQGQDGCFGCAAATRLCEICKKDLVAVPAVGMCSTCLTRQLVSEEQARKPTFEPSTQVHCQVMKARILVDMCFATQGQKACRNCTVPSRLCEDCQERPSRFPQYGLCLICSVKEFGEGWEPIAVSQEEVEDGQVEELLPKALNLILGTRRASALFVSNSLGVSYEVAEKILRRLQEQGVVGTAKGNSSREVLIPRVETPSLGQSCQGCGENRPIHLEKLGLCKICADAYYRRSDAYKTRRTHGRRKIKSRIARKLLPVARNLILSHQRTGKNFLMRFLHIGEPAAMTILNHLEEEGFLGPEAGRGKQRTILALKQASSQKYKGHLSTNEKISKLIRLIELVGKDSELGGVLRDVIADLSELLDLKEQLRKVMKKKH